MICQKEIQTGLKRLVAAMYRKKIMGQDKRIHHAGYRQNHWIKCPLSFIIPEFDTVEEHYPDVHLMIEKAGIEFDLSDKDIHNFKEYLDRLTHLHNQIIRPRSYPHHPRRWIEFVVMVNIVCKKYDVPLYEMENGKIYNAYKMIQEFGSCLDYKFFKGRIIV